MQMQQSTTAATPTTAPRLRPLAFRELLAEMRRGNEIFGLDQYRSSAPAYYHALRRAFRRCVARALREGFDGIIEIDATAVYDFACDRVESYRSERIEEVAAVRALRRVVEEAIDAELGDAHMAGAFDAGEWSAAAMSRMCYARVARVAKQLGLSSKRFEATLMEWAEREALHLHYCGGDGIELTNAYGVAVCYGGFDR